MGKPIWILGGHWLPNKVEPLAVFREKPTKKELLELGDSFFPESERSNKLIDSLIKHDVSCLVQGDAIHEYILFEANSNGDIDCNNLLWTGVSDMLPEVERVIY